MIQNSKFEIYFSSSFIFLIISSISAARLSVVSSVQWNLGICLILNFCLRLWLKLEECLRRLASAVPANFSGKTEMAILACFKSGEQLTKQTVIRPLFKATSFMIRLANSSFSCSFSCSIRLGIKLSILSFRPSSRNPAWRYKQVSGLRAVARNDKKLFKLFRLFHFVKL